MALKHVEGRVIVRMDIEGKNKHRFANGTEIRLERKYNNFNLREVNPVNGIVISAKNIPTGAEVLLDYNAYHDTYRLFNYQPLSGEAVASDIKYYSVPIDECYLWREKPDSEWQPIEHYVIAERVFEPYNGLIAGIPPTQIKDVLYIKSGVLKGNVVRTLTACDYCIVFQNSNGQEGNIIVCRHYPDETNDREELTCIDHTLTERVENGELLLGISIKDAKPLKYAREELS